MRTVPDHDVILRNLRRQAARYRQPSNWPSPSHSTTHGWLAGADARNYRGTIAAIDRMMHHLEVRIWQRPGDRRFRRYGRGCRRRLRRFRSCSANAGKFGLESSRHPFDVAFLVMTGQEDADTGSGRALTLVTERAVAATEKQQGFAVDGRPPPRSRRYRSYGRRRR